MKKKKNIKSNNVICKSIFKGYAGECFSGIKDSQISTPTPTVILDWC